jgi:hypothetical protein
MKSGAIFPALMLIGLFGCGGPRQVTSTDTLPPGHQQAVVDRGGWPAENAEERLITERVPFDLEIGVVVFDDGLQNPDSRDARDKLRSVESRLAAVLLRDTLTNSGLWGPVRVLPSETQFAELTITGEIGHSDGRDLLVHISAVDATGRSWVDQTFRAVATSEHYMESDPMPFRGLFVAISNQLRRAAEQLSPDDMLGLKELAGIRYAAELAPELYSDYVEDVDGRWALQRLPASDDPMLMRIARIRNQEALFIDTVDEQYVDLWDALGPTYRMWQRSGYEQAQYLDEYTARASARELEASRGSFAAMQQVYSTYRSVRIQEQDLFELATGFDNETAPTVLSAGDRVVRLSGTLDQQYQEWRQLLGQIFVLEYGLK